MKKKKPKKAEKPKTPFKTNLTFDEVARILATPKKKPAKTEKPLKVNKTFDELLDMMTTPKSKKKKKPTKKS